MPWRLALARPSSNRGQRDSSRVNPLKRVSLGTTFNFFLKNPLNAFSLVLIGSAGFIYLNVVILRFGEDIPGMEWLGTGMYNF